MSRYLVDQVQRTPRISVHLNTEAHEVYGDGALKTIETQDNSTGERHRIDSSARSLETSRPGVFAAGDIRSGSV